LYCLPAVETPRQNRQKSAQVNLETSDGKKRTRQGKKWVKNGGGGEGGFVEWGIGQWGRKVKQRQSGVRKERNIVRKENMEGNYV
jgi:hypothetical protein